LYARSFFRLTAWLTDYTDLHYSYKAIKGNTVIDPVRTNREQTRDILYAGLVGKTIERSLALKGGSGTQVGRIYYRRLCSCVAN
jgi:hypothetical protein